MRRLALRRLRADDGLSLVETVVALLVFSLFMTGLAASMTLFAHTSAVNKARSIAVTLAQKYVEEARAKGSVDLELCPGTTPAPPTQANFNNTTMFTAIAPATTATCMTYQKTKTLGAYTYTVQQLVFNGPSGTTQSGQPQTEKFFDVVLTWTSPVAGRYETSTSIDNNVAPVNQQATGISFDMQDDSNNKIGTATVTWHYKVLDNSTGQVVANCGNCEGDTEENGQPLVVLPAGNYTCFLDNSNASGWVPSQTTNPGNYTIDMVNGTITFPCAVTQNQVLDAVTHWAPIGSCTKAAANTKTILNVVVKDTSTPPVAISGATVTITEAGTSPAVTKTATTNTSGIAAFSNIAADWWYYTVSKSGYVTDDTLGPTCVVQTKTNSVNASLTTVTGCAAGGANVNVTSGFISNSTTHAAINGANVAVVNASTGAVTQLATTDATGYTKAKALAPGAYYYLASDKAVYDGSGGLGPVCVDSTHTQLPDVPLTPTGTAPCHDSATASTVTVKTTDSGSVVVGSVPFTVVDAANVSTVKTGTTNSTTGLSANLGLTNGPFFVLVNASATPVTGYFPTANSACITGTPQTITVAMNGYMTVRVAVDNPYGNVPLRSYNVYVTDPVTHSTSSQTVTVIMDPQGQSGVNQQTASFFQQTTANGYIVQVFVANQDGSDGTNVCGASQTYDGWTSINQTNTVTCTDGSG